MLTRVHLCGFLSVLIMGTAERMVVAQPVARVTDQSDSTVLVCPLLHAKAMPDQLAVPAMTFTGPAGDGRRGSAGFVVHTKELIRGQGTEWEFTFQRARSGFGFQVIHPLLRGHVLVAVGSGLTIHRGGSWGDIGWGNPNSSDKLELTKAAAEVLPLSTDVPHSVLSRLSPSGRYELWIDETLICQHVIESAAALRLETPEQKRIWGGSSWDRTPFAGIEFRSQLDPGHGGLILSPMDGPGQTHSFRNIMLTAVHENAAPPPDEHFERLFARIDELRNADRMTVSRAAGGTGGLSFHTVLDEPAVLTGFLYTASRHYVGHLTIKAVRPVFRSRSGEIIGEWHGIPRGEIHRVQAKDGYVVAGMVTKSGNRLDGMRLIYMRVRDGRLDPDDTYRSEWIGGLRGGPNTQCAANGLPVIGIHGRRGKDLDALGVIQVDDTPVSDRQI